MEKQIKVNSNCKISINELLKIYINRERYKINIKINKNKTLLKRKINIDALPIKDILSYSRLDTLKCPLKYKLKYEDKNYTSSTSLALNIGTLCHKGMELKYQNVSIDDILKGFYNGFEDEKIKGINELREAYYFEYEEVNEKSGLTYNDKVNTYLNKLKFEPIDEEWEIVGTELEFKICYKNLAVIKGFIDRVDKNKITGEIRVIDYKTNNKLFSHSDLTTPLQMYIYSLACYEIFGEYPVACIYDLLFFNEKQIGGTKGWMKRGEKKLDKVLNEIIWFKQMGKDFFPPKATPLCFWCEYCENNPNADILYKDLCDYYSLWTPQDKNFKTNKEWIEPVKDNDWDDDGWD